MRIDGALAFVFAHTQTHLNDILYIKTRLVLVHVPTEQRRAGCGPEPFEAMMMPQKTDLPESYKGFGVGFHLLLESGAKGDACFQW